MSELLTNLTDIYNDKKKNLLPQNLKQNITCLGVTGTLKELKGQTKTVTPTATTQTVMPDTNYNGLTAVTVNGDANLVAENIRKDTQIFDVVGTYEGESGGSTEVTGIKQFATEEEMQADSTAKEGDLALIYAASVQNAVVDSKFQTAKFPATVVLPETFTDYVDVRYRSTDTSVSFDCWGQLDANYFMMDCYTETGSIRIQYESSDGITYTRTDGGDEIVDFGTEIYYARPDYWNDVIGYFVQISSYSFGGLFEYKTIEDKTKSAFVYNLQYADGITYDVNKKDGYVFNDYIKVYNDISTHLGVSPSRVLITKNNNIITAYCYKLAVGSATMGTITLYNNKIYAGLTSSNLANFTNYKFEFTEDLSSYEATILTPTTISGNYHYLEEIPNTAEITSVSTPGTYPSDIDFVYYNTSAITGTITVGYGEQSFYEPATTQLTLSDPSELLPDQVVYGKNGIVTGDGSIFTKIPLTKLINANTENIYTSSTLVYNNEGHKRISKTDEVQLIPTAKAVAKFQLSTELLGSDYMLETRNYYVVAHCKSPYSSYHLYSKSGELLSSVTASTYASDFTTCDILDNGDTVKIFASSYSADYLEFINIQNNTITHTHKNTKNDYGLDLGVGNPRFINGELYMMISEKAYKYNYSTDKFTAIKTISEPDSSSNNQIVGDGSYLYIFDKKANKIYVQNASTFADVGSFTANCMLYNIGTCYMGVTNSTDNSTTDIYLMNGTNTTLIGTFKVASSSLTISLLNSRKCIYTPYGNILSVSNGSVNTKIYTTDNAYDVLTYSALPNVKGAYTFHILDDINELSRFYMCGIDKETKYVVNIEINYKEIIGDTGLPLIPLLENGLSIISYDTLSQ